MTEIMSYTVLFVAIFGILLLMVPGMRPKSGKAHRLSTLRRYRSPDDGGGIAAVVVAAFAAGQLVADTDSASQVGALLGVTLAVLSMSKSLRPTRNLLVGALGVAASFAAAAEFVTTVPLCSTVPDTSRWLMLGALLTTFTAGSLAALTASRLRPHAGLALFGVLDILTFLAAPLGTSVLQTSGGVVQIALAAVLGIAATYAPRPIIGLTAVAVTVATIGGPILLGTSCVADTTASVKQLTLLVCCVTPYLILRGATRMFFRTAT